MDKGETIRRFYCQSCEDGSSVFIDHHANRMFYPTTTEIESKGQGALGWLAHEFEKRTDNTPDRCEVFRVFDFGLSVEEIEADFHRLVNVEGVVSHYATLVRSWVWMPEGHETGIVLNETGEMRKSATG